MAGGIQVSPQAVEGFSEGSRLPLLGGQLGEHWLRTEASGIGGASARCHTLTSAAGATGGQLRAPLGLDLSTYFLSGSRFGSREASLRAAGGLGARVCRGARGRAGALQPIPSHLGSELGGWAETAARAAHLPAVSWQRLCPRGRGGKGGEARRGEEASRPAAEDEDGRGPTPAGGQGPRAGAAGTCPHPECLPALAGPEC